MIPPRLTTSARVAQIRAAIVRVKQSEARVREISTDPSSDSSRTSTARAAHVFVIADFGWQWRGRARRAGTREIVKGVFYGKQNYA